LWNNLKYQHTMQTKTALISGVNSGIGFETALYFISKNINVVGIDLADTANAALTEVGVTYYSCDVSDINAVKALFENLSSKGIKLQMLVNNAGVLGPTNKIADYPEESFSKVIDVNLKGVYYMMKTAIPGLLENEASTIVNVASVAGIVGMASHIAYSASKHAVVGMTKSTAIEYARKGLRVNAVCPGFTETAMVNAADEKYAQNMILATPVKRLGDAKEIAKAIFYLASDESEFVTGHSLIIDGGLTAQ
jgi:NAD(P)-dependent dehydrogenase (short-subunit alcohol dehydrogenase family)